MSASELDTSEDIVFDPLVLAITDDSGPAPRRSDPSESWQTGKIDFGYTCKKTAQKGDLYLFYFGGDQEQGIFGFGVCDGNVQPKTENNWPFWPYWPKGWVCGYDPFLRLEQPVLLEDIVQDAILAKWWQGLPARGGPKTLLRNPDVARRILTLILRLNPSRATFLYPYLRRLPKLLKSSKPVTLSDEDSDPPLRIEYTSTRILRNTALGDELKALYECECQVCGRSLPTPKGPYIEVHHLRPLGNPHGGPDSWGNMLVLCPNCHAEFDGLGIAIHPETGLINCFDEGNELEGSSLLFLPGHELSRENTDYHWNRFCEAKGASARAST
jgi:hypothetical protein